MALCDRHSIKEIIKIIKMFCKVTSSLQISLSLKTSSVESFLKFAHLLVSKSTIK